MRGTILKMKGHPTMLLKIKDGKKIPWRYPRILLKAKSLTVSSDYLSENKWLG
jgi:hypothetical protein